MKKNNQLVKVEWEVENECDEYCTVWITYTIDNESIKRGTRVYSSCYNTLWVTNKDFWFVLRYLIGDTLEKEREDGDITMSRLNDIIYCTDNFYSDDWGEWLHDFAWVSHYGNKPDEPWIKEFMVKVEGEYREESGLVGLF